MQDNHFKIFGERRRTNRERKRNSQKLFKKVISCFSSVLFLVLSVSDGTLGLKWYRARSAIMAGAKQWFLRLLYFQLRPISLILLTKGMKKGNYIVGRNMKNRQNSFCSKNHHNFTDESEKACRERVWKNRWRAA